jgi:hypothetical protein
MAPRAARSHNRSPMIARFYGNATGRIRMKNGRDSAKTIKFGRYRGGIRMRLDASLADSVSAMLVMYSST